MNEIVPSDFNYTLHLGDYNPGLYLEFCDGAMAFATANETFDPGKSIFEQIKAVNWDRHRAFGMQGSQFFDSVSELSKELTHSNKTLPSTAEIQRKYRKQFQAFEKMKRKPTKDILFLIWQEYGGVVEESFHENKGVVGSLMDLLTTHCDVIGVIVDGELLSPKKIDALKQKALAELKEHMPISYARAVGLF